MSSKTFAYSGTTGTWAAADPTSNLSLVFLTNRTYHKESDEDGMITIGQKFDDLVMSTLQKPAS
jgi:CubicO group peptidase (beta-lactamase class C family)